MKRKRYEVRGMMEWHPEFKVGRVRLKVAFTGGHLCGGARTAACFVTDDPVVQAVIERSEAFRSKRIRVAQEWDVAGPGPRPEQNPAPATASPDPAVEERIEYDDIEDIAEFLQDQKGVSLERLVTREQCIAEGKRFGVALRQKPEGGARP